MNPWDDYYIKSNIPYNIPDHGMGRSAAKKRMEDRSLDSAAFRSGFNTGITTNIPKDLPKYNMDYSGKGKDPLSFNTDISLGVGNFAQSQNKTAEQSGDTWLGQPVSEGQAAAGQLSAMLSKLDSLIPKKQPTKGTSPGEGALSGVADEEGYVPQYY